jgi:Ca2+-binding EF-hand superfamily protein
VCARAPVLRYLISHVLQIEAILVRLGFRLSKDDLASLLEVFDRDGHGHIDIHELCQVLES